MKLLEELAWCCWPCIIPAADSDSWHNRQGQPCTSPLPFPPHQLQHPHGEVTGGVG